MACFDSLLSLDSGLMSQAELKLDETICKPFENQIESGLPKWIELQNVQVSLYKQKVPSSVRVYFEYRYQTQFILAGHIEKLMVVELDYEIPIDN